MKIKYRKNAEIILSYTAFWRFWVFYHVDIYKIIGIFLDKVSNVGKKFIKLKNTIAYFVNF